MISDRRQDWQPSRAVTARVVVIVLVGVLVSSLFYNQVIGSSAWSLRSDSNRLRSVTVPPPRGIIRDRAGRALADNISGYSVSIIPAERDSMMATLARLQNYLQLSRSRYSSVTAMIEARPRSPVIVSVDAPFDAVAALQERRSHFPRMLIEVRPKRRYPAGEIGAHVIGYVGEIGEGELKLPAFHGAEPGRIVGKSGIERQYEAKLQGSPGTRYVEVDAARRTVGSFAGAAGVSEEAGEDIDLYLDLDLMEWIHRIFPEDRQGSVVALEVETGGVLALYSAPAFDPNLFAGTVDPAFWAQLSQDPRNPLYHRAAMGTYAPGSLWKLATAAIALDLGLVTPDERMSVPCRGAYRYGNRLVRCWDENGHGSQDLIGAIQNSCNVYFYQLGLRIGLDRLLRGGNTMGFGARCGIDLPQEAPGIFPTDRAFWDERFGEPAGEGEVLSMAIGQGPNSQTPLKMAQFLLAIARDGSAPPPRLYQGAEGGAQWSLDIEPQDLERIREGTRRVTQPGGTAHLSSLEHFDLLGKTGTAQSGGGRPDHAWFFAMAGPKGRDADIVVVALVEFGGSGSAVAAPLVAKVADHYLRGVYGIPRDTIQTLGEHLRAGRNASWGFR